MKILIHSNGPSVSTGYGVQCRLLVERLVEDGHDVAVSCTYGQQGGTRRWRPENPRKPEAWENGIVLYPQGYEVNGNDVIHNHALHHFGGDPLGGWIIPLLDVWCLVNPLLKDFNIAAWTPVDHFPVPPGVLRFFERTDAVPVGMSRFGERLLNQSGLDARFVPLAVDTTKFKPTPTLEARDREVSARELFGLPNEAFVVGMVAMNKDANDRKGFCEAFAAFGAFWRSHPDAVLFVHSDPGGMGSSFDLHELAIHCSVPEHAIKFSDGYAYRIGLPDEMMAAAYSAMDVLLAPSHGEGFCVPLIEAQACGTPVIVTNFSAQPELVGAGWKVMGQQQWDPAQHAFYIVPFITEIVEALEQAYVADLDEMETHALAFTAQYDADHVYDTYWRPLLAQMEAPSEPLQLERVEVGRGPGEVAVLIPALNRPHNVARLVESLSVTAPEATAYYVCDPDDTDQIEAVEKAGAVCFHQGGTFAEKINHAYRNTTEPWLLVCGDDVEFHPGWLSATRELTGTFDVVGTNDSLPGRVRNPGVADGTHADHFLVRRSYVDEYGASLDGPGVLAPEVYGHFFTDKEIVELAKARGVFAPCLESVVEHHHPAFDGLPRDAVYNKALECSGEDQDTYVARLPLIRMQRTSLGKR